MRSLFLRTFLWFWVTAILAIAAVAFLARPADVPIAGLREALFSGLLPQEANASAQIFESSGAVSLNRHLKDLELRYPIQAYFFGENGDELQGRAAPYRVRDLARVATIEDRPYVIVNLAAQRATGPSGKIYSLVILQEPSQAFRKQSEGYFTRLLGFEFPIITLLASGLFCYFTARQVTSRFWLCAPRRRPSPKGAWIRASIRPGNFAGTRSAN